MDSLQEAPQQQQQQQDYPAEWLYRVRNVPPDMREQALRYLAEDAHFFQLMHQQGVTFIRKEGKWVSRKRDPRNPQRPSRKDGFLVWQTSTQQ